MYRKILVPLDGSDLAEVILPHVLQLAEHYKADILFLQVIQLSHSAYFRRQDDEFQALPNLELGDIQQQIRDARAYLESQVRSTAEKGIQARFHIAFGPVAAAIINTAIEEKVDLIAMASHGASGIQGVYYGSVAAGVLQRVDRPLLIVRSHDLR
jgi:nucleotide-binding universal stress UspA family protein